jgi:hypothetical protein
VDQTHLESEKTKRWAGPCCFWGFPFSFLARAKRSQSVSVSHADTTIVIDPGTDKCCYGFSSLIRRTRRSPLGSLRRVDAHPPAVPNKREQKVELPNEFDLIRARPRNYRILRGRIPSSSSLHHLAQLATLGASSSRR